MIIERLPIPLCRTASLYLTHIDRTAADRAMRSRRERQAVMALVTNVFGPDATYTHRPDKSPMIEASDRYISVSHSRDYAVLLVGDHRNIGVDIEQMRSTQLRRVSSRFLSEAEQVVLTSDEALLWAWTAKEAVYKAAAIPGLSGPEIAVGRLYGNRAAVGERIFKLNSYRTTDYLIVVAQEVLSHC